ncbi:MAG: ATP-binding protein [Bacteroidetes bacterium]|nr:ATP-binding protein [Bacteroidota bacterium]MCL6102328.1 ATP-binding protein [Bacteroidota bacterium]
MDFKRISIEDGLSNSVVFSISQDCKGLMWFGTRTGVDSYDGTHFSHYNLSIDENTLPTQAAHIYYDANNNLWAGTINGLFKYNAEKEKFQLASSKFSEIVNPNITKLLSDHKKHIWIGTNNSLYVFFPEKDSIIHIREITIAVNDILYLNEQYCLVATTRGIFKINSLDYRVGPISSKNAINEIFNNKFISTIYKDQYSRIWIAVQNKGIYIYDPINEKLIHVDSIDKFISPGVLIKDIKLVNESEYLIATDGNGILSLNLDLSIKDHYYLIDDNPTSLSNNGIYQIFKDSENRVWIATYGGGISLYDPYLLPFKRIEHITNNPNSIANNTGRAILEDQYKRIWFGTKKGISIYNPENNKWSQLFNTIKSPSVLGQNTILSICQVTPEEVWIGSYGGGIDRINTKTLVASPVFPKEKMNDILGSPYVFAIFKSKEGYIWIGLLRSQLIRYNPLSNEITRYPINNIQDIQETSNGKLILGSKIGLYVLDKSTGEFKLYYHKPEDPTSISSNAVCDSYEAKDGKIYIGTEGGGLNLFDPRSGKFKCYRKKNGLPSNSVYGIIKDHNGMLWLSTTNGISMFNPMDESFTNYDTSDGLNIKEFNYGASCSTSDGNIIFGGSKGFVSFDPDQIKKISIAPKLIFTDLKISNRSVKIDQPKSLLDKQIDLMETLSLKFNQNSFSLSFIGLNYTNPVKNQYSWKLEGFEKEWTPRSSDNSATYTNIPPGEYTFRIRSTNVQDDWNGTERSIKIRIRPPFYLTYWAFLIYTIILTTIALLIFKYQRIRFQEQHAKEKIQFFINIAHDLRTPLTLIQSPLSKISENKELGDNDQKYLNLAQKNAGKLAQLFNQLLDFQKADLRKMQLQVDQHDIIEHLKNVLQSFQPLLDKKRIECELKTSEEKQIVWYDQLKFDKIFYNLISNAVKYSRENGNITISVNKIKKKCCIELRDNGIGIPAEQQKNVFKHYFRATNAINSTETGSGVGLMLVKHLVNLHNGQISFESSPGEGTCFKIKVPVKSKHYQTSDFVNETDKFSNTIVRPGTNLIPDILSQTQAQTENNLDIRQKSAKVVVVEDNEELLTFLVDSLQSKYRVHGARNGKEALTIIEKVHPDIIISDIMMPEMDGTTLCAHLKRHIETCHIPVILLTALTDTDYKIEGYEMGADGYLEKPFEIKLLISRIENLLKSRIILKDKFLKFSNPPETIDYKSEIDQKFIQKAVQLVNDNLNNSEFSVEEFSKQIFMSRPVLYRKLKALTDQSPQDFIKIIRLKKAVEYLQQTDLSINEVAYQTGFSDPKYFSTCFKKYYGTSPTMFSKHV